MSIAPFRARRLPSGPTGALALLATAAVLLVPLVTVPAAQAVPVTVPDAPGGVSAVAGDANALVSWSAPGDDGGASITRYTVVPSSGTARCEATGSPCLIAGLANGVTYTFTVIATNSAGDSAPSVASAPVVPAAIASTLTLTGSRTTITYGGSLTLSGLLSDAAGPLAHQLVTVQSRTSSASAWSTLAHTTTSTTGTYADKVGPARGMLYRTEFAGVFTDRSSASTSVTVQVAPRLSCTLHAPPAKHYVRARLTGTVYPTLRGRAIKLQRFTAHGWSTVRTAHLSTRSTYNLSVKITTRGVTSLRVVVSGGGGYVSAAGPIKKVRVR